jgi:5-methyltetrahydropteroyltriglutamate--homocysteine methyltransferase
VPATRGGKLARSTDEDYAACRAHGRRGSRAWPLDLGGPADLTTTTKARREQIMFTTTDGTILPTTVTGSWPRPSWFGEGLWHQPFSTRMNDLKYREPFTDSVTTVIGDQERAGLDILTNGDYHHDPDLGGRSWLLYPVERLGGVTPIDADATSDEWAYPPGSLLNEVMGGWRYPGVVDAIEEGIPFEYAKIWRIAQARTARPVKFGAVSAQVAASVLSLHTDHYPADKHQLMWDMATVFNKALRELAEAGCRAIQVEEPLIHVAAATTNDRGYLDFLVECFNHEVSGLEDVEVWAHTCWGNPNMQRVLDETSYENSLQIYMERLKIDVWTIEAKDNPRPLLPLFAPYAGNFGPKIALGVVSHRSLQADTADEVAAEVRTALEYIDPEHLVLTSDCGFGRQGFNRLIAFYKATAIAQGANRVRAELGFATTPIRAADPALQTDVPAGAHVVAT